MYTTFVLYGFTDLRSRASNISLPCSSVPVVDMVELDPDPEKLPVKLEPETLPSLLVSIATGLFSGSINLKEFHIVDAIVLNLSIFFIHKQLFFLHFKHKLYTNHP